MRLNDVAIILTIIVAIIAISTFLAGVWDPPQPTPEPTPTPTPTPTPEPTPTPTPVQTSTPLYPPYTLPPTNNPPVAFVDSINPNPARQEQSVTFTCHGDDSDSGDCITEYRWESSIDGFLSNQKTFSISSLSSGLHQIILRVKDSHGQWSSEITRNLRVEAIEIPPTEIDDTTPEPVPSITPTPTLKPTPTPKQTPIPPPTTGAIRIDSSPSGATVELDGKRSLGPISATPATIPGLDPGYHTIKLTLAGYQDWTGSAHVTGGETTDVHATFDWLAPP